MVNPLKLSLGKLQSQRGPNYSPPPREAFPLGCLHAATTPASKGLGAANLLIVA